MGNRGGTKKWCPYCKTVRIVTVKSVTGNSQNYHHMQEKDIQYFRREVTCRYCQNEWVTVELNNSFINELVELRAQKRLWTKRHLAHKRAVDDAGKKLAIFQASFVNLIDTVQGV